MKQWSSLPAGESPSVIGDLALAMSVQDAHQVGLGSSFASAIALAFAGRSLHEPGTAADPSL